MAKTTRTKRAPGAKVWGGILAAAVGAVLAVWGGATGDDGLMFTGLSVLAAAGGLPVVGAVKSRRG